VVAPPKEKVFTLVIWAREMENAQTSLLEAFAELTDPRGRECEHKLEELLFVATCI
jgi:hypothetical protein